MVPELLMIFGVNLSQLLTVG